MAETVQTLDHALRQVRRRRLWRRYLIRLGCLLVVFAVGMALFQCCLGIRIVDGDSMEPTLCQGDLLLFINFGYEPQYGDVVLLETEAGSLAVKRVVGLAGDQIELTTDGRLTRNGQTVAEPYASYAVQDNGAWISFPYMVPEGTVFCLGDHRALSMDSRIWGGVLREQLRGKVLCSVHWNKFG